MIEIDGGYHAGQLDYDAERTANLESKGYRVLRFHNVEVLENIEQVIQEIKEVLR